MTTIRASRTTGLLAALGAVVLAALVWASPAAAHAAPDPPQLSIAVDDGRGSAGPSDTLDYTTRVTNLGTRTVEDLIITQTVPDGAALESTDPEATEKARTVSWSVDVEPGRTATVRTTVAVAKSLPDGLLRFATVACARTSARSAPLVCASDSDQLPAGAAADEQRQTLEQEVTADAGWWPLPGAPVLGGLVLGAAIAALLILRRRDRDLHLDAARRGAVEPVDLVSSSRD